MKKDNNKTPSVPPGFRIKEVLEQGKTKFVVEMQISILFYYTTWRRVKKICLDVITDRRVDRVYRDRTGRGYLFTESDGECRSFQEALEFLYYIPLKRYMTDGQKYVVEAWANNHVAMNFVSAGKEPEDISKSRIGIYLSVPDNKYFEEKGDFWEKHFAERYGMEKIA